MNYRNTLKHHMGNIRRASGGKGGSRYEYMINQSDIASAYMQMRDELGYPLMIDSRNRRAIVYNKKGVEKKIQQLIDNCILSNIKLLENMVATDIVNEVNRQLNGITQMGKTTVKSSNVNLFASAMTKGLMNGIGSIVDDMINGNDEY